jgi:hypothetical protein
VQGAVISPAGRAVSGQRLSGSREQASLNAGSQRSRSRSSASVPNALPSVPWMTVLERSIGGRARPPNTYPRVVLWDRLRARHRRDAADVSRTRKLHQIPGRDDGLNTLVRCRFDQIILFLLLQS